MMRKIHVKLTVINVNFINKKAVLSQGKTSFAAIGEVWFLPAR